MKRIAMLLPLLAGCSKPMEATVRIKGEAFRAIVIRTREHFRDLPHWDPPGAGRAFVVAYPRARFQHYESKRGRFDLLFTDSAGKVAEIASLDPAQEEGVTSSVEVTHAVFLSAGTADRLGVRADDSVELNAPLRENLPPLLSVLRVHGHEVRAEIASTPEQRAHGFMYWKRLSPDDGLLFVYDQPESQEYWMSNCAIDLDIAFFRSDGTLINVVETRKWPDPKQDPGKAVRSRSDGPAQYVLETNFGWFRAKGLIIEDGHPNGTVRMEIPADVRP